MNNDANNDSGEHELQCAGNSLSSEHDVTLSVKSSKSPLLTETSSYRSSYSINYSAKTSSLSSLLLYQSPHIKNHTKCQSLREY